MVMMLLWEIFNALFLYPRAFVIWVNTLTGAYYHMLVIVVCYLILYLLVRYLIIRFSKKTEKTADNKQDSVKFFPTIWSITRSHLPSRKYLLIGFCVTTFAWIFISMFLSVWRTHNEIPPSLEENDTYASLVESMAPIGWDLASVEYFQAHARLIFRYLGSLASYALVLWIFWGFCITFCFGNKFLCNLGILFCVCGCMVTFLWGWIDTFFQLLLL